MTLLKVGFRANEKESNLVGVKIQHTPSRDFLFFKTMGTKWYRQCVENYSCKAVWVGTVKTLNLLTANDNVEVAYALAA